MAVVAAHEIGHACLHVEHLFCDDADIAGAVAQPSHVPSSKVGDYGPNERRELEANVFARELLLPREFCRRLHIEQGMSVKDICSATSLPARLVKQQLLDALLLPPQSEPPLESPSTGAAGLDHTQKKAVDHRSTPFQLIAGPGTGKTRTLIARIVDLVEKRELPESILVLTFSNKAATEITDRLKTALGEKARRVWVGTFHSFGLDLVRRYYDQLDLPPDPPIYDRSDSIDALEELLPVLPLQHYYSLSDPARVLKDVLVAISRAKDELIAPKAYRDLGERMRVDASDSSDPAAQEAAAKSLEVAVIYDEYQKMLQSHGAVDFGDLVMRPALLLANNEVIRQQVQERHRHVLVDEYQDVNFASVQLLKGIVGDGNRLWVVGDPRQSIYRFRGAARPTWLTSAPTLLERTSRDSKLTIAHRLRLSTHSLTLLVLWGRRGAYCRFPSKRTRVQPVALSASLLRPHSRQRSMPSHRAFLPTGYKASHTLSRPCSAGPMHAWPLSQTGWKREAFLSFTSGACSNAVKSATCSPCSVSSLKNSLVD